MNTPDDSIESVLRRAPRPQPPPGLRQRLVTDIPQPGTDRPGVASTAEAPWWRRWWPALAAGTAACACLAVVVVQQGQLGELEAAAERAGDSAVSAAVMDSSRAPAARSSTPAPAEVPFTEGAAELEQLRATAAGLKAEIAELQNLKAENEQLRSQAAAAAGLTPEETQAITAARGKAQRIVCVNNLKQLGLAARIWATDHGDVLPPDLLSMSEEMTTPKILVCPADEGRQPAPDWASFSAANTSYQYLAASGSETEPQRVAFVCPIHHNVGLCDGSVQQLTPERFAAMVQREGKLYLENPAPTVPAGATGMDPRMMERYGLQPGSAPTYQGAPAASPNPPGTLQMSPELMKRYGLQPVPPPAQPVESEEPADEEPTP